MAKLQPDPSETSKFQFCPFTRIKNTTKLFLFKDMLGLLRGQIDYEKPLQKCPLYVPTRGGSIDCNYTVDREWMREIFSHPRSDPNDENSLFKNARNHVIIIEILRAILKDKDIKDNDCIMTSDRDVNIKFREVVEHHFNKETVDQKLREITEVIREEVHKWLSTKGKINISEAASRMALTVLIRVFLKSDVEIEPILKATHFLNSWMYQSVIVMQTPDDNFEQTCRPLFDIVNSVYDNQNADIITEMKEKLFTDKQIKTMIIILFFAGQETTASALADAIWQLARHQEIQDKLRKSILEGDSGMIHKTVAEALRIFPPAWGIGRFAKSNLLAGDFPIAVNNAINLCPFLAGRDPTQFAEPELFNPDREESILHFPWLPFGYGAHACPGRNLALNEIYICLETLLTKAKITTEQTDDIPVLGQLTLKRVDDIYITIESLENSDQPI